MLRPPPFKSILELSFAYLGMYLTVSIVEAKLDVATLAGRVAVNAAVGLLAAAVFYLRGALTSGDELLPTVSPTTALILSSIGVATVIVISAMVQYCCPAVALRF